MQMKNTLSVRARADSPAEHHIQILQSLLCQSMHGKGEHADGTELVKVKPSRLHCFGARA